MRRKCFEMGSELLVVVVVEALDRCLLYGLVHPLDLTSVARVTGFVRRCSMP